MSTIARCRALFAGWKARAAAVVLVLLVLLGAFVGWLLYSPDPRIALVRFSGKVQGPQTAVFRVTNPSRRVYSFYLHTNQVAVFISTWTGMAWGTDRRQWFRVVGAPAWLRDGDGDRVLPPHSSFDIEGGLPEGIGGTAIAGISLSRGTEEESFRRMEAVHNGRLSVDTVRLWLELHGVGRPGALFGEVMGLERFWSEPFDVPPLNR
jgi:hypothetical protein